MSSVVSRRIRLFLLIMPLALLSACRDRPAAPPVALEQETVSPSPVTITWSFWGDAWELAVNQRMLRAFERDNPGIQVEMVHRPWGEYFTWLKGEWAAGRSPDVMFLNYIPSYVPTGELEPLDSYAAADSVRLNDFYPALLDSFRVDGTLYGLPRDNDTKVIYYNRTHFQEAGLPEPGSDWTWQDLRRAALALTRNEATPPRHGFGFEPAYWWLVWLWQGGGDVLDDPRRPTTVTLDSPRSAAAFQFLQDLIHVDRVTPPPAQLNTDDLNRLFREGRLSMVFGNHTLVPWFAETPGLSWDVAPLPRDQVRTNVAGGAGFVVSRRSPNKDAAWQLVQFLTSQKAQAILAESGVITPARRSVREDNIFLRQQPYRADVFLAETELGRAVPNFPGVNELEKAMDRGLEPLWRGEKSAPEVIRDLVPRLEDVIRTAGQ